MSTLLPIAGVVAGYVAGTLIALILDRVYTGAPVRGPLALCPEGHAPAAALTGTIGWLALRGRCPCNGPLPARLWYLPVIGAVAGALIGYNATGVGQVALISLFSLVLLAFVGTDFERHLLPNRLMAPAMVLALALAWAWPGHDFGSGLLGGGIGLVLMGVLFMIVPGFGMGDVKLAGLVGLLVGVGALPVALILGFLAGGAGAAVMLLTGRAGRKTAMAYGPYLALGAFLAMLAG